MMNITTARRAAVKLRKRPKEKAFPNAFNPTVTKAIQPEVRRHVSINKRLTPYFIPFTGKAWNGEKDAKGRKPFFLPLNAGRLLKIPIKVSDRAAFHLKGLKISAWQKLTSIEPALNPIYRRAMSGSRFSFENWLHGLGTVSLTNASNSGTDPKVGYDLTNLFNGTALWRVILVSTDFAIVKEIRIDPTGGNGFDMYELDGTTPYNWTGTTGNHWAVFAPYLNEAQQDTIAGKKLKIALYAKSPTTYGLYGNEANVTGVFEDNAAGVHLFRKFPHIERLWAGTMQGAKDGAGIVETPYLIPRHGSILIEIENASDVDLYVQGTVFGLLQYAKVK